MLTDEMRRTRIQQVREMIAELRAEDAEASGFDEPIYDRAIEALEAVVAIHERALGIVKPE